MAQECLEALQKEIEALKKELAEEKVKRGAVSDKAKRDKESYRATYKFIKHDFAQKLLRAGKRG